jgi:kumamolisin
MSYIVRRQRHVACHVLGWACLGILASARIAAASQSEFAPLTGHIPPVVAASFSLGRMAAGEQVSLALTLPLRNQADLSALLSRLYDSNDPLYGQYLTPEEFTARFGPTQADYDTVAAFARTHGLTVTGTHANRLVLDVTGPKEAVEAAFGVQLLRYQAPDGHTFHAPSQEPTLPAEIAARLSGVVGLENAAVWHTHLRQIAPNLQALSARYQIGTGPGNGLAPSDIKTAYGLSSVTLTGAGQSLAVLELAGYNANDIYAYTNYFHLTSVPLQNVLVDGASGRTNSGSDEAELDIELETALASGVSKILVYEGPNTNTSVIDTYNQIATDNLAKQISTSWGASEQDNSLSTLEAENTIFQQMAAQGQTVYAAAGDDGAYDNGKSLSVDDPASQPYVVGVGGTTLSVNSNETYNHETTWNDGLREGAGGGGISSVWPMPAWQKPFTLWIFNGSTTMRNVPDVSLNADPNTGYSIYYRGRWYIYGGTSCTAPLWAAFTALANQNRLAHSKTLLGFTGFALYALSTGAHATSSGLGYFKDFHDIADGSNNLNYYAVPGYDMATGLGSFNGANLLTDMLSAIPAVPTQVFQPQ